MSRSRSAPLSDPKIFPRAWPLGFFLLTCGSGPSARPSPVPAVVRLAPSEDVGPTPNPALETPPVPALEPTPAAAVAEPPVAAAPVIAAVNPPGPQQLVFPSEGFRSEQPRPAAPRPFQLPGIRKFSLARPRIDVYLVERHTLPTVSLGISFAGGAVNDPKGKEGLAGVCTDLMGEGTRKLEKLAFEEAQADIASSVSAWSGTDEQGASMSTLSKHLDRTLDLFTEMLFEPGFRQSDLDRLIARHLEALKQAKAAVASVAGRVQGLVGYGPDHALGRVETEASYRAISVADCAAYHKRWFEPRGARVFVVGDISEAQIRDQLGKRWAAWSGTPARSRTMGVPRPPAGRIFFVPVEKSAQSTVNLLGLGPKRGAADYFATEVMSHVFGGGFAGRLNMNLREAKGWAYGARGGYSYHRQGSTFFANASVQTDHTRDAILEIHKEIASLHDGSKPATGDEIAREKDGSILGLPGQFATAAQVLAMYRDLLRFGLPLDYYNSFVPKVGAVNPAQVAKAAAQRLVPKDLRALVVGDPVSVLPGLYDLTAKQTLGPGDLVLMDADGNITLRVSPALARTKSGGATSDGKTPAPPAQAPAPPPARTPAPPSKAPAPPSAR